MKISFWGGSSYLSLDIDATATARYHFNLGIDKLDVYSGFLVGAKINYNNIEEAKIYPGILWGAFYEF